MRILYHHRTLGDGAEGIHIKEMVQAFKEIGHEVRVVSLIGEDTNQGTLKTRRWNKVAGYMPGALYEIGEMAYNLKGYMLVFSAIQEFRPDFVYDRYVAYNYSAVAACRKAKVPILLEVNSPYAYQRKHWEKAYFPRLMQYAELKICRDASKVIVVSTPLKRHLISLGIPEGHVVVMPNGANPKAFQSKIDGGRIRIKYGMQNKLVLGFVGILRPWHGLEMLIDVFSNLKPQERGLHLFVIGDGPIQPALEALVRAKNLKKSVTFTGRVPHEGMEEHIAAIDIAISPQATFYASPMKILEYMAMAKAFVAPDMENIKDIVDNRYDGILFEPENGNSLEKRLLELVENQAMRDELGSRARKKIESRLNWVQNARNVLEIVEHLE